MHPTFRADVCFAAQVKKYCQAKRLPDEHPDASGNVRKPYHSSTLWADAISGECLLVSSHMRSSLSLFQMASVSHRLGMSVQRLIDLNADLATVEEDNIIDRERFSTFFSAYLFSL